MKSLYDFYFMKESFVCYIKLLEFVLKVTMY